MQQLDRTGGCLGSRSPAAFRQPLDKFDVQVARFDGDSLSRLQSSACLAYDLPAAVAEVAQEEAFPLAAGRRATANQPGRQHLRVVEDEYVVGPE